MHLTVFDTTAECFWCTHFGRVNRVLEGLTVSENRLQKAANAKSGRRWTLLCVTYAQVRALTVSVPTRCVDVKFQLCELDDHMTWLLDQADCMCMWQGSDKVHVPHSTSGLCKRHRKVSMLSHVDTLLYCTNCTQARAFHMHFQHDQHPAAIKMEPSIASESTVT